MGTLTLVVEVACLGCGARYPKPAGRGTVRTNPGCPVCGYLGWSPTPAPEALSRRPARCRFDADPLHRLAGIPG